MKSKSLLNFLWIALPILLFMSHPLRMTDLGIWIRLGEDIFHNGLYNAGKNISFLPLQSEIYPSWGSSLLLYFIDTVGGLKLISLFFRLWVGLIFIIYLKLYYPKKNFILTRKNLVILFISIWGASFLFVERPAFLAILPFVIIYYYFDRKIKHEKIDLLIIFLLSVLMINLHASSLIFLPMSVWFYITRGIKQYRNFYTILVIFLGTLINPWGIKIYIYALETTILSKSLNLLEWQSPFIFSGYIEQSIMYILLLVFLSVMFFLKRIRCSVFKNQYLILILFGIFSIRNTSFVFLFLPSFLHDQNILRLDLNCDNKRSSHLYYPVIAIISMLIIMMIPFWKESTSFFLPEIKKNSISLNYPDLFIKYVLHKNNTGNIFSDVVNSSSIAYGLRQNQLFIDARNIVFKNDYWREYFNILYTKDGWNEILSKYKINYIVITDNLYPIQKMIEKDNEWTVLNYNYGLFIAEKIEKIWGNQ